ncbi:MAG: hypothetical protein ACO38D_06250, partial [Ilumatobacteraceae bacterium]
MSSTDHDARTHDRWTTLDFTGQWRIAAADDTLLRNGVGLDYDHDEWAVTQVPGHWQSDPDFAHHDGPFL